MNEREQKVFFALSDATRRGLIETLSTEGDKTPTELARDLPITRQGISKHLTILAEAGLVSIQKDGREKRYALIPDPLAETVTWVQAVQDAWDNRLTKLREYIINQMGDEDNP